MEVYKFIVWADTHHDKLAAKCVNLQDTIEVEKAIFQRAISGGFDFTLFAGDRYLKREPDDEVKVNADKIIFDLVDKGKIPHFHLIGNHDWVDNSLRWHTSESLKRFRNVCVMDEVCTYRHKNVAIHALPADMQLDLKLYEEINSNELNIFVFHDTVVGTYMNEERSLKFENGMRTEEFDVPQFDIVFAGDIHIRQPFDLKYTKGGYLGSVTQRTRADANYERGWTEIVATNMGSGWTFDVKFVPTKNLFTRVTFQVDSATQITDLNIPKKDVKDQLVEVKLIGDKANVDRLAEDIHWKTLELNQGARRVELLRAYQAEQSEVAVDLTKSDTPVGDLELYLDSEFSSIGTLKREAIVEALTKLSEVSA